MGVDRTVRFPAGVPSWDAIRDELRRHGESPALRMIDGLPAFPDESPDPDWKEVRVGLAAGMVTLRRGVDTISCVVWGNADDSLRAAWDKVCRACAAAGGGEIG